MRLVRRPLHKDFNPQITQIQFNIKIQASKSSWEDRLYALLFFNLRNLWILFWAGLQIILIHIDLVQRVHNLPRLF